MISKVYYYKLNFVKMKRIIIVIVAILMLFNLDAKSQKRLTVKQQTTLVTKPMSNKISYLCLNNIGYYPTVFYESNKHLLKYSDLCDGKDIYIFKNLHKYPKYSENFIRKIYETWGYNGLKEIGFTDAEIVRCKKIINKIKSE